MNLDLISKDVLFKIALELPIYDLLNLCQTNKKFYTKLCRNPDFWKTRAINILGYDINNIPDKVDQQWYLDHCGTVYGMGDNQNNQICLKKKYIDELEPIYVDIKFIYVGFDTSMFINGNGDLFICYEGLERFIMKNVKQVVYWSRNEIIILDKEGKLFVIDKNQLENKKIKIKSMNNKVKFNFISSNLF